MGVPRSWFKGRHLDFVGQWLVALVHLHQCHFNDSDHASPSLFIRHLVVVCATDSQREQNTSSDTSSPLLRARPHAMQSQVRVHLFGSSTRVGMRSPATPRSATAGSGSSPLVVSRSFAHSNWNSHARSLLLSAFALARSCVKPPTGQPRPTTALSSPSLPASASQPRTRQLANKPTHLKNPV